MKQFYKDINFRRETLQLVSFLDRLIGEYVDRGFRLSVRQLYYQLVARDMVPNTEQSYKRVASIINDARLCGLLDWDAIEDRNRDIEMRTRWLNGSQIMNAAATSFHMDMWAEQDYRVFVIVEKAALAGVLGRVCREYDVPLLAARGYPSVSIVREMAVDHILPALGAGQCAVILHLGDHDPSGIDMTRDLRDRFDLFLDSAGWAVRRIALTMDQIEEQSPPPNPAKTTDSRFASYRREFGTESWELDALNPEYLENLVQQHILEHLNEAQWAEREQHIEQIRSRLHKTANNFE